MGVVTLVLVTVSLVCTLVFGGLLPSATERVRTWYPWLAGGRVMSRIHAYQPPERKSVVIDLSGMSHLTADRTSLTKRDRSRLYPFLEIKRASTEAEERASPPSPGGAVPAGAPVLSVPLPAPPAAAANAPLFQSQIEEIVLPSPGAALFKPASGPEREPSLGRKVQQALLADRSLSRSIQLTLTATSVKNKVTLRGIVLDKEERDYVGAKAAEIAGAENVDNRLTIL